MKTCLLFFTLFFFMACSNTKTVQSPPLGDGGIVFDKQGHRGCRGLMPENTIPAMMNAIGLGVTTLELDVVITKDKKVILSHEPFFNHEITTKPDGSYVTEAEEKLLNIFQMNYDEVKKFDVGMKPHPRFLQQEKIKVCKPLLSELFDTVKQYMMRSRRPFPFFNIETKCLPIGDNRYHPKPDEFVDLLMTVIKEKEMEQFVNIQSFDFRTLQYLHSNYPGIKIAILIEDNDKKTFEDQLKALGFTPEIYSPHFSLITADLIKKCHEKKIKIIPWTVNEKEKIADLKLLGVDGVITDYPNLFNEK